MANRFTTVLTYECWSYHATSLILVWVSGCLKNIFLENDNYLTNFLLIKPIVKRIPSRGFWAYKKGQSSRIYRPGFMDKHDHVISWNKDLLSQVSWFGKKQVTFSLFNFCLYISRNDPWILQYVWIKRNDVTK